MAQRTEITCIIPNYNGADVIGECLASVFAQSIPCALIVVDDGSTDESLSVIEELLREHPEARLLRHTENKGFAAAVNTGILAAKTPYVLLFNNDATAKKTLAERMLQAITRREKCFSVSGLLLQAARPYLIDDCGDYFSAFGRAFSPGRDKPRAQFDKPAQIQSACAGCALYDRKVLLSLGLFDEAFGSYLEDVDLGLRALRAGYSNEYEPSAVAFHKASHTSGGRYNAFKARQTTANTLLVIAKNVPLAAKICFAPLFLAGLFARAVFYASKGLFSAYLNGLRDGICKIRAYDRAADPASTQCSFRRDLLLSFAFLGNCIRALRR
ncbi:MAG: glycosyltransferase family 2 protein [Lachnospiraceae bacterium]|nr:glycosyltransferase family 2 protein [Lachnospiraceae bacterium]